jgi:RNA polymerase sigma-70 factor, ECF subfamily
MNSSNEATAYAAGQEEQHLLARARGGNAEAFETLLRPHRDKLLRASQRILRNREDAEDAVQTALLNAWRNLDRFEGRSRFASWLTRIVINCAFMQLRSKRTKKELSLDEIVQADCTTGFHVVEARPNPEHEFSANEVLRLIESVLHRLEPHYLEVLEMSVLQELTGKEAARILDLPVSTVKSRLFRARGILSRNVKPMLTVRRRRSKLSNCRADSAAAQSN